MLNAFNDSIDVNKLSGVLNSFRELIDQSYDIGTKLNQRGIADYIEAVVIEKAQQLYGKCCVLKSSKKGMEDLSIISSTGVSLIDVKSHNIDSDFSMPNLTAIEKLVKLYKCQYNTEFYYLFIEYNVVDDIVTILDINLCQPHNISWECLSIANLGLGQLQIKDMSKLQLDFSLDKNTWFSVFISKVVAFKYKTAEKLLASIDRWESLDVKK